MESRVEKLLAEAIEEVAKDATDYDSLKKTGAELASEICSEFSTAIKTERRIRLAKDFAIALIAKHGAEVGDVSFVQYAVKAADELLNAIERPTAD